MLYNLRFPFLVFVALMTLALNIEPIADYLSTYVLRYTGLIFMTAFALFMSVWTYLYLKAGREVKASAAAARAKRQAQHIKA